MPLFSQNTLELHAFEKQNEQCKCNSQGAECSMGQQELMIFAWLDFRIAMNQQQLCAFPFSFFF